jgi:hypothetical protein
VNFGVGQSQSRDLQQATDEFVKAVTQGGNLRARGSYESLQVDGREGRLISFDNVNEATVNLNWCTSSPHSFATGNCFT